jgi:hypothetical protein
MHRNIALLLLSLLSLDRDLSASHTHVTRHARTSHVMPHVLQYQVDRTKSHTCCALDSNACLQVVAVRLRVVIEATASVRCSDHVKSVEFTARTLPFFSCRMHLMLPQIPFFSVATHFPNLLSARMQVFSVDEVSEATGARRVSFRQFINFDILFFLIRRCFTDFWNR